MKEKTHTQHQMSDAEQEQAGGAQLSLIPQLAIGSCWGPGGRHPWWEVFQHLDEEIQRCEEQLEIVRKTSLCQP